MREMHLQLKNGPLKSWEDIQGSSCSIWFNQQYGSGSNLKSNVEFTFPHPHLSFLGVQPIVFRMRAPGSEVMGEMYNRGDISIKKWMENNMAIDFQSTLKVILWSWFLRFTCLEVLGNSGVVQEKNGQKWTIDNHSLRVKTRTHHILACFSLNIRTNLSD
jgi:hypothetical protein